VRLKEGKGREPGKKKKKQMQKTKGGEKGHHRREFAEYFRKHYCSLSPGKRVIPYNGTQGTGSKFQGKREAKLEKKKT